MKASNLENNFKNVRIKIYHDRKVLILMYKCKQLKKTVYDIKKA